MNDQPTNQEAVAEIAQQSPEAAALVYAIVTGSMNANNHVTDQLLEVERVTRMAREVQIQEFLAAASAAFGGTVREYEGAIDILRFGTGETDEQLAARHWAHDLY